MRTCIDADFVPSFNTGYLPFGGVEGTLTETVNATLEGNPHFDEVQWSAVSDVSIERCRLMSGQREGLGGLDTAGLLVCRAVLGVAVHGCRCCPSLWVVLLHSYMSV